MPSYKPPHQPHDQRLLEMLIVDFPHVNSYLFLFRNCILSFQRRSSQYMSTRVRLHILQHEKMSAFGSLYAWKDFFVPCGTVDSQIWSCCHSRPASAGHRLGSLSRPTARHTRKIVCCSTSQAMIFIVSCTNGFTREK